MLFELNVWVSLLTLTFLEIVLGVDNLIFISIISSSVAQERQKLTRRLGLLGALITRLLFLSLVFWMIHLIKPLITIFGFSFSARDFILIAGGLFLLVKSTTEIHHNIEGITEGELVRPKKHMASAIAQIMIFDIIFSLDSVMTAVGLSNYFSIMVIAIIISILVMMLASEPLHRFIEKYPTLKMLAFSFLMLIGVVLVADGFKFHIPREYIYFAILFSVFVEILNHIARTRQKHPRRG